MCKMHFSGTISYVSSWFSHAVLPLVISFFIFAFLLLSHSVFVEVTKLTKNSLKLDDRVVLYASTVCERFDGVR